MSKHSKKLLVAALLTAISGTAMIAEASKANARPIDGVNKDIICKRPKTTERQLKLHSCATLQYGLVPLAPSNTDVPTDAPPAGGGYSS